MNTTKLVLPFFDFSTIPYEFSKLAEMELEKGTSISQNSPWKDSNHYNLVLGRVSLRNRSTATNSGEIARWRRGPREGKGSGDYGSHVGGRSWVGEEL
jgi:hypothetical protein